MEKDSISMHLTEHSYEKEKNQQNQAFHDHDLTIELTTYQCNFFIRSIPENIDEFSDIPSIIVLL
ncbi:MAG: hypothetical protein LUI10_14435 [Lachnospiraceae bacterium]|nr:hypothetical protein [Lachnospiraceae bacterium]